MIFYHQLNIAAFAGNHSYYWVLQPIFWSTRIAASPGAGGGNLLFQRPPVTFDGSAIF